MSGMANAASTMPGSVATFWSCSSERSERIASSSSASANSRAGTRMSGRALAGISHSVSSTRRGSDIEHHPREPAVLGGLEGEPVIGGSLDQVRRSARAAVDGHAQTVVPEPEVLETLRDEALGLAEDRKLGEPVGQQGGSVGARQLDGAREGVPLGVAREQLPHRLEALGEDRLLVRRDDFELELARVLHPAV